MIRSILPAHGALHRAVVRFLGDVPAAGAGGTRWSARPMPYTRLSGGLAEWARRIECSPRMRIIGTAGSGKTQLAMAAYRDALAAGRRPLTCATTAPWPTTSP
jgi:hypothetical protein